MTDTHPQDPGFDAAAARNAGSADGTPTGSAPGDNGSGAAGRGDNGSGAPPFDAAASVERAFGAPGSRRTGRETPATGGEGVTGTPDGLPGTPDGTPDRFPGTPDGTSGDQPASDGTPGSAADADITSGDQPGTGTGGGNGTAGPAETGGAAAAVSLPITAVTCLEDRAQVERSGTVRLAAGVVRLRVGPVTPLAVDRSLRAELSAPDGDRAGAVAHVVDARVVRAYTPAPPGEPAAGASQLSRDVEELERGVRDTRRQRQRVESRLAVIRQAKADLHRDIVQGAGAGDADPERWADRLDRVDEEAEPRVAELHRLGRRLKDLEEELDEARRALEATEGEPLRLTAYLELVVEAERAGEARLSVVHLVPCALWRPAYRATLAGDRGSVLVETDAFVWQDTGEDWHGVRLSLSTARPTLAASPPRLTEDVLTVRERSAEERRTVEVDLREEEIRTTGGPSPAGADDAVLPGLHDGGEVRVLTAPHPVDVASDRRPHRVRLSSFTAPCRTEDTCAPELSPLVVTTARFTNTAGHVLLAGPVDLLRGSGFTGRGRLEFAGAGAQVRLAFGSEDTFRVVRHVEESRDTAGLTGINQRTVITREVRLFVSRLDASDDTAEREVVVRERVPVSEVSAVEVRLRQDACRPAPDETDADGVVRYTLRLPPGARREITLVYDLTASGAVVGL
ncbi:mucoidy inhibitor MuiA family protein [Streptantibioticus silvisoli]|uniref:mucoidy inhibitor MuiA family protein n=1 Tax=Streptantibioticus silvisoli TaxID=2705255 RepID=UPI0027E30987|nr:mucoidy inhibitor MuiA family protein [Streptantibioticus silvisoli]